MIKVSTSANIIPSWFYLVSNYLVVLHKLPSLRHNLNLLWCFEFWINNWPDDDDDDDDYVCWSLSEITLFVSRCRVKILLVASYNNGANFVVSFYGPIYMFPDTLLARKRKKASIDREREREYKHSTFKIVLSHLQQGTVDCWLTDITFSL